LLSSPLLNGEDFALQPDGKVLLAGEVIVGANWNCAVARYTAAGVLDTSFNGTGILMSPISAGTDYGYYLALQPDGKIILAGSANFGTNSFTVARYTSSGALDTSFNTTGFISTPIGANDQPLGVVLQSDGKIVLAGRTHNGTNYDIAIVRYR
jgi:uncharacterized delta-60 repeat protein